MPETLIKVDLTQSAYDNDMVHNRWHPDIPMVAYGQARRRLHRRDLRLDRRLHQEQRFRRRRARHRPVDRALPLRPDRRRGRRARRPAGGRPPRHRRRSREPVGLQRLLLQEERRRLPRPSTSRRRRSRSGTSTACYTKSRHIPGVRFAGLIHPGLIGCLPDPKTAGDLEHPREGADRRPTRTACRRWPTRPFGPTAHMRPAEGRGQGQGRRRGRPHGAAARARRQLRHQGPVARLEDLLPGLRARRRPLDGRPALQPGRRRDHLLRRDRDGRLGAHQGRA